MHDAHSERPSNRNLYWGCIWENKYQYSFNLQHLKLASREKMGTKE